MEKNLNFEKLTLNEDVSIEVYNEALDFAFSSPDIKNIAISGAYGAGKSSVLASYKKTHQDKKFIHISLAHFADDTKNDEDKNESVLEGKILNQLIHQIPPQNIPQTNFKVKQSATSKQIKQITAQIVIYVVCMLFLFLRDEWNAFTKLFTGCVGKIMEHTTSPYICLLVLAVLLFFSVKFTYNIISLQKNKKLFKKVNFKGAEIEIFESKDDSYFDKYLNEVLYLFEKTDVDAIVFEDMDRFEMNHIFERLREINTLVNLHLQAEKKTLKFLYLLRDDVFVSKDRTKIFDYIIPIVPVVDGSNSYDQFIEHLKNNNLQNELDSKFLQGLSLYVDDMRLLKNICNEFLVYYNRLNTTELDCNKMFALITYKNLFPRDFSDLQLGRGFVATLFSHKSDYIKEGIKTIGKQIEAKQEEIERCAKEHLQSKEELECVRKAKDADANAGDYSVRRAKREAYNSWLEDEYKARLHTLEIRENDDSEKLVEELHDLELKLIKIKSAALKDIITRENIDTVFATESINEIGKIEKHLEIRGSEYFPLLKYLIRNGYIDETYTDYMTYFYANSISKIDKIFLRSIADKKAKDYSYELKDPQLVVSRLDVSDFGEKEILNFYLLKYLFKSMPFSKQLEEFIKQLSNSKNIDFIRKFLGYFEETESYVKRLNQLWPSLFKELLESDSVINDTVHRYCVYTLTVSSNEEITMVNINNCLKEYIEKSPCFLNIYNPKVDKIIDSMRYLDIKLENIDYTKSDKDLFKAVYDNNLYKLTYINIKLMLSVVIQFANKDEIAHKNFTLINKDKNSPIYKYICCNINDYLVELLDNCDGEIFDDEEAALELINFDGVDTGLKVKYIHLLKTTIQDLSSITDSTLWSECLDAGIISKSNNNIAAYFQGLNVVDEKLINYINSFEEDICLNKLENYDEDIKSNLFVSMLKAYSIKNNKYRQILTSMNRAYINGFSIDDVPEDKMSILIEEEIIKLCVESLTSIRKNYPENICQFIKLNFSKYIEIMSNDIFDFNELLEILNWDVSDEEKISLLGYTKEPISILHLSCSDDVKLHILKNNLQASDIVALRKVYDSLSDKLREFIFDNAVIEIQNIVENFENISFSFELDLLNSERINNITKFDLIIESLSKLSKDQAVTAFQTINKTEYVDIFSTRKKPKFEVDDQNEYALEQIKKRGWIYDYYVDGNDDNFYRIRHTKPQAPKLKVELL